MHLYEHKISLVVEKYVDFLAAVCHKIRKRTGNAELKRRKFKEIKKELYNFLNVHRNFYNISHCCCIGKGTDPTLGTLKFNYSGTCEEFLKLSDFIKHYESRKKLRCDRWTLKCFTFPKPKQISNRVRNVFGKYNITENDMQKFFDTRYLVTKDELNTKFPTYHELASYIDRRRKNYIKSVVSTERIIQMSFKLKGSLETLNDEKSCGVCLEDYKRGQQVCRMPCNHFCCRKCAEQMFKVPKNRSKAHFQCPICRHDCT